MAQPEPPQADARTLALWYGIKRALGILIAAIDVYVGVDQHKPGR